jgi:hypothetical protein
MDDVAAMAGAPPLAVAAGLCATLWADGANPAGSEGTVAALALMGSAPLSADGWCGAVTCTDVEGREIPDATRAITGSPALLIVGGSGATVCTGTGLLEVSLVIADW